MTAMRRLLAIALCAGLAACVNQSVKSTSVPAVANPDQAVPEELLLDVNVAVFDPGLEDYEEADRQVFPEVRRAESRYMPGRLAEALQESGAWGAVRVVPDASQVSELLVTGTILHSDGEELKLGIRATDARGRLWLENTYTGTASRYAYEATARNAYDPFQAVYNTIANDLLQALQELEDRERRDIRLVTELRFARAFSPDAFDGYLEQDRKGAWQVKRLPAEDDPMLARVRQIRDRDRMFVDTLQDYYHGFEQQMDGPYQEWRKLSYEEAVALQELRAQSARNLLAGAVAVVAGIAAATTGDSSASRAAGQVAVLGGGYLLKTGLEKRAQAQIHVEALDELGQSLEAEITPQVIELEDRTVTLSGNVEQQYSQWRELLAEIYRAEIGELALPEERAAAADTL